MPLKEYYSAEDVRALPDDGNRYETVYGELLVSPSPAPLHQRVLARLQRAIGEYLARGGIEGPYTSPADISWSDDTLVQPDLFVADLAAAARSGKWSEIGPLHLAVEILSPSSLRADRFTKRRLYQQHVATYWVVDPEKKLVEVWTPPATFPVAEHERLVWRHPALGDECVIELEKLFGD